MYSHQCSKSCLTLVHTASLAIFSACARGPVQGPGPGPVTAVKQPTSDTGSSKASTLSLFTPGQIHYQLEQVAIVEAVPLGDSLQHADSMRTRLNISVTLTSEADRITARVRLDSGATVSGTGTSTPITSSEALVFYIDSKSGDVVPADQHIHNQSLEQQCSEMQSGTRIVGSEVLPTIRTPVSNQWVDTLETSECRAGVALVVTRTATYTRDLQSDQGKILRSTQVTVRGAGYQWAQRVDVAGSGTALDTLEITETPQRIQRVSGSSQLQLSFTSSKGTQRFRQTVITQIFLK